MNTKAPCTVAIVIPSYNDTGPLRTFYSKLKVFLSGLGPQHGLGFAIVIVDDGSKVPLESCQLESVETTTDSLQDGDVSAYLLRHIINLGQGAALRTGITFALNTLRADYFVTMDSDGQHRIEDFMTILNPVLNGQADIVFGNRFAGEISPHMPKSRKVLLRCATVFERVVTGLPLSDAHNGYRAFNKSVAVDLKIRQNRMAHATEIKQIVARRKYRFSEVPVSIDYSDESLAKGQRNSGSLTILKDLMRAYLFSG
jgi:glycosyltransferase involved in cell wall biosynthesis